jgi:hypothetical protein
MEAKRRRSGSPGNRTLPYRLRAECSALELETRGSGRSRTATCRVKSPLLTAEPLTRSTSNENEFVLMFHDGFSLLVQCVGHTEAMNCQILMKLRAEGGRVELLPRGATGFRGRLFVVPTPRFELGLSWF